MMTIYLHGSLKPFGSRYDLYVEDAAEAVRALCHQLKGFRAALQNGSFKLRSGNKILEPNGLEQTLRDQQHKTLHITPVVAGAGGGKGGLFQVVMGATLIAAAFWTGGWALAGLKASTFATSMALMGTSMIFGGVAQLLTKIPKFDSGASASSDSLTSTSFSSISNVASNGQPIPLIYGELMVGSLVISQGIVSYAVKGGDSIGFTPIATKPVSSTPTNGTATYTKVSV